MKYIHSYPSKWFCYFLKFLILNLAVFMIMPFSDIFAADSHHAIITTTDGNGTLGSYSWIQEQKSGGSRLNEHNMMPTIADIRAATHGQYYYIMEGEDTNRITCYDITDLDEVVWQYGAQDTDETSDTLPWAMISISDNKAYLLRYGSNTAWIIDPLAENESNFKTGEIDLSAYDDGDGSPEMCCGILIDTYVYVALRRVDADGTPQTAYLVVIDTDTDTSVDTGKSALGGIPLSVKHPVSIGYLDDTELIYVQGSGAIDPAPDYTGGIESVDPETYDTAMIVDDGDNSEHLYGYITAMVVISSTDGFFIGAVSETDNTLYHFSPDTGDVETMDYNSTVSDYMQHKHFSGLNGGLTVDVHDRLWIGNVTDRQVEIITTTTNQGLYSSDGSYEIPDDTSGNAMQPSQIVFCTEPGETDSDEAAKPSSGGEGGNFCFINTIRGN